MKSEIFFMCRTEDEKKHSRDFFDGVCYKKKTGRHLYNAVQKIKIFLPNLIFDLFLLNIIVFKFLYTKRIFYIHLQMSETLKFIFFVVILFFFFVQIFGVSHLVYIQFVAPFFFSFIYFSFFSFTSGCSSCYCCCFFSVCNFSCMQLLLLLLLLVGICCNQTSRMFLGVMPDGEVLKIT